jgi:hypothetical protein
MHGATRLGFGPALDLDRMHPLYQPRHHYLLVVDLALELLPPASIAMMTATSVAALWVR